MPGLTAFAARQVWLDDRASELINAAGTAGKGLLAAAGGVREAAALFLTIGIEHLNGASAFDVASRLDDVVGADWTELVPSTISKVRSRALPRLVAADLLGAWASFVRSVGIGKELPVWWHDFERAFEGRLPVRAQSRPDHSEVFDDPLLEGDGTYIDRLRNAIRAVLADPTPPSLDWLQSVKDQLVFLEVDALIDTKAYVVNAVDVLDAVSRVIEVWAVMPGGWCDRLPPDDRAIIPEWFSEAVVTAGARSWQITTGPIHTWMVVSDGEDDGAFPRLLAELGQLGIQVEDHHVTISLIAPRHAGDSDPVWLDYGYDGSDPESVHAFAALALNKTIRLDVLQIVSGTLAYLGSTHLPLPGDFCEQLGMLAMSAVTNHWGGDADRVRQDLADGHLIDHTKLRFLASENGRYELLWEMSPLRPRGTIAPDARRSLEDAREGLLAVWSDDARQRLAGLPPDRDRANQARRSFDIALSHARTALEKPSPTDVLPDSAGFLHLDFGSGHVELTMLANVGGKEVGRASEVPLDPATAEALTSLMATRHGRQDLSIAERCEVADRAVEALNAVVAAADPQQLLADVDHLIVSCGPLLDGLPIHACEALRDKTLAYAPSLRFLAAVPDRQEGLSKSVLVLAHDGDGAMALPALRLEAEALRAIYPGAVVVQLEATPAQFDDLNCTVLHVIAHGRADADLALRGFQLAPSGPAGFVSAADILRRPLYGVDLVYLSACSSSVSDHRETVVQSFGGVDFAFLSAGARTAIASCWDVSDTTAALLAVATHHALSRGEPPMVAYRHAQALLRDDFGNIHRDLADELERTWPGWDDTWHRIPNRLSPFHWASFRLSGAWW